MEPRAGDRHSGVIYIEGYNLIRNDRLQRDGGRVAIYIKNGFAFRVLHNSSINHSSEYLIIQVKLLNEKLLFGVLYRPPRTVYPSDFFNTISNFLPTFKHIVITGDFNSNMLSYNNYSRPIYNFISNNDLYLVPSVPTCHKPPSNTWLDLFIVSNENNVIKLF